MRRAHALSSTLVPLSTLLCAALAGGCGKPSHTVSIYAAPAYAGLTCPPTDRKITGLGNASLVRVSARERDAAGAVIGVCDATFNPQGSRTFGFPIAASKVDLFVEVFGGEGNGTRIASGALLGVDPLKDAELPVVVYEAEKYRCSDKTLLHTARAFHTATALDNGDIVFAGGLTAGTGGADAAAPEDVSGSPSFYVTGNIEVYNARTRTVDAIAVPGVIARAFHRAAVLSAGDGTYTILLAGGLTSVDGGAKVATLVSDSGKRAPNSFRFFIETGAKAAPSEILRYDSKAGTITREDAPAPVQAASGVLQGAAQLAGGGVALAGGMKWDMAGAAQTLLATTRDGATVQNGTISTARAGATLAGITSDAGITQSALLFGGVGSAMDRPKPFERVDLAGLKSTALGSTLMDFPTLYVPTVTAMDGAGSAAPRFLVSGALEVQPGGITNNPLSTPGATMFQVQWNPAMNDLQTLQATLSDSFSKDACSRTLTHYKVVAFDAATALPAGDRVLATGGTPRNDKVGSCFECEDMDDNLACAVGQSLAISVPASANEAPRISPLDRLTFARFGHTQSLLPDGNVLVAGGLTRRDKHSWAVAQTEIFNPAHPSGAPRVSSGTSIVDVDDPLRPEILATMDATRDNGTQIYKAGDGERKPLLPCTQPEK